MTADEARELASNNLRMVRFHYTMWQREYEQIQKEIRKYATGKKFEFFKLQEIHEPVKAQLRREGFSVRKATYQGVPVYKISWH